MARRSDHVGISLPLQGSTRGKSRGRTGNKNSASAQTETTGRNYLGDGEGTGVDFGDAEYERFLGGGRGDLGAV